ncbi:MAG: T9SS type A sorting domain-containing protein, partial [Bacteroidota bacterium]
NNTFTFSLKQGYQDDFFHDFGWIETGDADTGEWEFGEPNGTSFGNGQLSNPNSDVDGDIGTQCWVTGNDDDADVGDDDIDGGSTRLSSPLMDLTIYNQPIVKYRTWFVNAGGNGNPNDDLTISISNGTDEVVLETITESNSFWRPESAFAVENFITITETMRIIFEARDIPGGHLVEAGVDAFFVEEGMPTPTLEIEKSEVKFDAFPNPFAKQITVQIDLQKSTSNAQLKAFNLLGQQVATFPLPNESNQLFIGHTWGKGIYLLNVEVEGEVVKTLKVVKE